MVRNPSWCLRGALSVLTVASLFQNTFAQTSSPLLPSYPIVWSTVPTTPATGINLTTPSPSCTCNIEPFVCDPGCCCDPDCPDVVSSAVQAASACLPDGSTPRTLDYCVPGSIVAKVNLPSNSDFYNYNVQAADNRFFSQLLCIKSDRNPNLGDSYPDPPAGNVGGNQALASCPGVVSQPTAPSTYGYRSPIYMLQAGSMVPLAVPYPALSDVCVDGVAVGFYQSVPVSGKLTYQSCSRITTDPTPGGALLQQQCVAGGALSPDYWYSLKFYATPTTSAATPVTLVSLQRQAANGTLTTLPATTVVAFDGTTCSNAAAFINITVLYTVSATDNSTSIQQMLLTIITADVTKTGPSFRQSSRVQFLQYQAADTRVLQPLSGAPGYLTGFPLLAGPLVTYNTTATPAPQAIQRLVNGLPLPAAGSSGVCDPLASLPVAWGLNTTSTCAIPLTGLQLQAFCVSQATLPQQYLQPLIAGVYDSLVNNVMFVGFWGNSNFTLLNQWIQVQVSNYPFNSLLYSTSSRSCANVIVGFDLRILTGVAFATSNLQNKLLFANLCFRTATWSFPAALPLDQTNMFLMTSTVSFVPLPQQASTNVKRPAPPLVTYISPDIFYPFVTSGATNSVAASSAFATAALVCLALILQRFAQ